MNAQVSSSLKKSMSRPLMWLGGLALAAIVAVPVAYARGGHHGQSDGACASGPFAGGFMGAEGASQAQGPRLDKMVQHMLSGVDVTAEQQSKITAIVKAAWADQATAREQMRTQRGQLMTLLAAPTIDRAALEQLRGQQLAAHQAMSKRMTDAMADAAEVLTPAQRAAWLETRQARMSARGSMR